MKTAGIEHKEMMDISNSSFSRYGRVLNANDYEGALDYLVNHTVIPDTGNRYVAHDRLFEEAFTKDVVTNIFGELDIQYGYVNGNNTKLNALEYHKSSEILVVSTPIVLMVGRRSDMIDNHFDSSLLHIYYVPENSVLELFPLTLHFSPCKVEEQGFKCGVILPYGTNTDLEREVIPHTKEDLLLFKKNKWIIAHPENKTLINKGANVGITGMNIEIIINGE